MHPIDMLSAYVIGGIGAWVGALMMLIALRTDRSHRFALLRCAWGFALLGTGMVHSGFADRALRWPILSLALSAVVGTLAIYRGLGLLVGTRRIGSRRLALEVATLCIVLVVAWADGPRSFALVFHVLCLAVAAGITWTMRRQLVSPRNLPEAAVAGTLLFYAVTWVVALVAAVRHDGAETRYLVYVEPPLLQAYALLYALLPLVVGALVLNLANARLAERLRRQASTDELTGLLSRRALHERAPRWWARTQAGGGVPVLLLIDIDHFKAINDTHGHDAGDEVLRVLSARMRDTLPAGSLLGRYGGEEFLALVPASGLADAATVAEALREAVRGAPVPAPRGPVAATVSIGVAPWPAGAELGPSVTRADLALYAAKAGGRDRVVLREADAPLTGPAAAFPGTPSPS